MSEKEGKEGEKLKGGGGEEKSKRDRGSSAGDLRG